MTDDTAAPGRDDDAEWEGPILAEIHAIRARISEECGHDMRRIFDYFIAAGEERKKQEAEQAAQTASTTAT